MPFEHGTDPMATGMKETLQQLRTLLLKTLKCFERLPGEVLLRECQEFAEMVVVVAG
jgi:hypothetical protein